MALSSCRCFMYQTPLPCPCSQVRSLVICAHGRGRHGRVSEETEHMHACTCSGRLFQRPRLLPAFSNLGTHPAVEGAGELMVRPSLLIVRSPSVNFPALVLQGEQVRQRGAPEWDACLVQATPFILPPGCSQCIRCAFLLGHQHRLRSCFPLHGYRLDTLMAKDSNLPQPGI